MGTEKRGEEIDDARPLGTMVVYTAKRDWWCC
jgi:hypothetical protein